MSGISQWEKLMEDHSSLVYSIIGHVLSAIDTRLHTGYFLIINLCTTGDDREKVYETLDESA